MKRKEETAIILSALATAGVPESNQVKSAVDYGLKLIRIRKFEERTEPKEGLPMLEKWTGDLIGKMHNSKVTYDEVAAELGCTKTYLQAPPEWLGQQFIDEAEHLKATDERAYQHEYLGIPVGTGGNVFDRLELREITDEEVSRFDKIYQGVDFGWFPDPFAFIRLHYDKARETIYLLDEIYQNKLSNEQSATIIKQRGYGNVRVICDSAEPKSVADLRAMGLPAYEAVKGPGSVEYGMKFLQRRTIVIDRKRTPHAYDEFVGYEYERNKDGDIISGYPDANNHLIDATRYALEPVSRRMGVIA